MADLNNSSWSETDSSNTQPAPSGFPSGILPSQVGGVVRAMMGAVKRAYNHGNAMVSSTGSVNAYVLTYEQPLQAGYVKGEVFRFFAHATNTGASTLNINGAGTRAILRADGTALSPNEIVGGHVVTVVFDGANFLHQSVGSRFFKDSVSITKDSDAILTLEDTSAAANTFRRKAIYSTKNDGASGSNWLFRQTRPSDEAIEDFYLKGGTGGDIWTTGNFNPALKASLNANVVFNDTNVSYLTVRAQGGAEGGEIKLAKAPTSTLAGDVIIDTANNSLRIYENGGAFRGVSFDFTQCGAQSGLWHSGNFDPGTKMNVSNPASQGVLTLNNGGVSLVSGSSNPYIYTDVNANNLVVRTGAPSAYRYSTFQADGFLNNAAGMRANGDLFATGRVIAGEGQTASYIEMRDTNEGTRFVHNNSGNIGFLGSDGGWKFYVRDDGTLWSAQMGDINTRIEDRANAWSASRRDEANTNTANNYVNKTNGSTQIMTGDLEIKKSDPAINFRRSDNGNFERIVLDSGSSILFQDGSGNNNFSFQQGGALWTRQLGDLNTRIEDRANSWSATRRDEANANTANNYFNKTTGTQQVVMNIPSFNASAIDIVRGNVLRARWTVDGVGNTILQNGDTGDNFFYVNTGGGIWTKEFGWLSTRIEDRAAAWARQEAGARVAKTGDTMSGDLTISKANPSYNFFYGGVYSSRLWVGNDAVFRYSNNDGDGDQFRISPGGAVWTKQLGDLNNRIEDRAYAWAATRQANLGYTPVEQGGGAYMGGNKIRIGWDGPANAARLQVDDLQLERILTRNWINPIIDVRLAYAGDLDNNWNVNAGGTGDPYSEPYGGAVITSRYTSSYAAVTYWSGARWRYLQKQDSYGNWYTVGYA